MSDNASWIKTFTLGSAKEQRDLRIQVFQNTLQACQHEWLVDGEHQELDALLLKKMQEGTEILPYLKLSRPLRSSAYSETIFEVLKIDTFDLTKQLIDEGLFPAALNMANGYHPGGGVEIGAAAQEESLFRRSNLHLALYKQMNPSLMKQLKRSYRIPEHGVIYTPSVQVLRDSEAHGYSFITPYTVCVISAAPYDLRVPVGDCPTTEIEYIEGTQKKIRSILRAAAFKEHDSVVLGAMGCGIYENDPEIVAKLFYDIFQEEEFIGQFSKVAFGVLTLNRYDEKNFESFQKFFS
ncbi:MAG: hypothetical protein ACI9S8_000937 [Chlamydiales bacterium]|jgi:uncharacterized protein (TIGR02452 family)